MKRRLLSTVATLLTAVSISAQTTVTDHNAMPQTTYENCNAPRSEFMSYTIRATATEHNRTNEWNYVEITEYSRTELPNGTTSYTATVDFPEFWGERTIIVHTEGGRNSHRLYVDDQYVGSARDSGVPSEFELPAGLRGRTHTLRLEVPTDTREPEAGKTADTPDITSWFLYSQPETRIWDYNISADITGNDGTGLLTADVIVENNSISTESFAVCFDVFSPAGNVEEYGMKEVTLPSGGRDTVRIKATIYGAGKRMWSAEKPNVYTLTLFIRQGKRIMEYVPVNVGFGSISYSDGIISRNGHQIKLKAIRYDATTAKTLCSDIVNLKKQGYNTLWVHAPQPYWFYDECDRRGIYVIDQANINSPHAADNMRIGGTLSNDPAWLPEYMHRTQAMFYRTHNHPCIIGWSLGEPSGNGFNLYRTYLWLHNTDPSRPVIYSGAAGNWNSDIDPTTIL